MVEDRMWQNMTAITIIPPESLGRVLYTSTCGTYDET
jgi:hypothetical protein